jgi:hypothetical protein
MTTVLVQFTPSGFGTFSDVVQFMSNGNWLTVAVTGGTGVQLSGRVTDTGGAGVGGVTVNLSGASSGNAVTDATGHYQLFVPPNNGYILTPTSPGRTFTPLTRSVTVGTQDASGLNFTAAFVDAIAAFVAGLYADVLGRAPDAEGLAGWTGFLHQHCNSNGFTVVADGFFDSSEFRTSRPFTLPDLVRALYRTLLAREPEPAELTGWVDVFRQERRELASDFVGSAEFQSLLPDRTNRQAVTTVITRFYAEILGRAPDAVGLTGWVDYIVATRDVEGTAGAFVTSGEFEARALTFRDYVTLLYRGILGRNPELSGLDGWESLLRFDLLSIINGGFIPSAEFQGRIPRVCN